MQTIKIGNECIDLYRSEGNNLFVFDPQEKAYIYKFSGKSRQLEKLIEEFEDFCASQYDCE